jgi:hypothetical protein
MDRVEIEISLHFNYNGTFKGMYPGDIEGLFWREAFEKQKRNNFIHVTVHTRR